MNILEVLLQEMLEDSSSSNFLSSSEDTSSNINESDELDELTLSFVGKDDRNAISRYLEEVVPSYNEKEFITHFRVSRELYHEIVNRFASSSEYSALEAGKSYSPEMHVALFLWFAGHEACCYKDFADRFNLALGTVCRIINCTLCFLSSMSDSTIVWPTNEEKAASSSRVESKTAIQGVIGAIDGSHIRIDPPKRAKNDYINRKNVMSICLKGICNEKKQFIDMFVGYPGSVHDNRVFGNSDIYPKLPNLCGDFFILRDSAYVCSKQVITPYRDNGHLSAKQIISNKSADTFDSSHALAPPQK